MSAAITHLIKLSVGSDSVEGLAEWQETARLRWADKRPRHITRMWPRRADEVLNGGSIYWVIKGVILCRQRILDLQEVVGEDGIRRCGIVLDTPLIRVEAVPRRAFQGWRYLPPSDAPRDLDAAGAQQGILPPALQSALAEIGVR